MHIAWRLIDVPWVLQVTQSLMENVNKEKAQAGEGESKPVNEDGSWATA